MIYASDKGGRWAIYRVGADGSGERRLTDPVSDNYNGVWSPDGRSIAFVSERDGNRELYLMNADGSGARRLTNHPGRDEAPAWSPDGQRLAFVSDRDGSPAGIYWMALDGRNVQRLINAPAGWPTWSRRNVLVFTRPSGSRLSLFSADLGASGVRQITPSGGGDDDAPAFSPDGSRLAFSSGPAKGNRQIVVTDSDGGNRRYLTPLGADTSNPAWSPDAGWLAFASDREGGTLQVFIMRADGSDARRITGGPGKKWYLSWKP